MKQKTVVKAVRMRISLFQKIEKMAIDQNRNFSNMCETILIKAVNNIHSR